MSKWWKIFPWKFGKGSVSPTSPCEIRPWCKHIVKISTTASGIRFVFWVFYCLCHCWEMSMRNLFAESICFGGLMGPAVLFSSEKGCRLFTACFDALVLVPNCILYVCDVSLSLWPLCSSSSFKHHFPFLMPGRSIRSDLPVPSNPWSDRHLRGSLEQLLRSVCASSRQPSSHRSRRWA